MAAAPADSEFPIGAKFWVITLLKRNVHAHLELGRFGQSSKNGLNWRGDVASMPQKLEEIARKLGGTLSFE